MVQAFFQTFTAKLQHATLCRDRHNTVCAKLNRLFDDPVHLVGTCKPLNQSDVSCKLGLARIVCGSNGCSVLALAVELGRILTTLTVEQHDLGAGLQSQYTQGVMSDRIGQSDMLMCLQGT